MVIVKGYALANPSILVLEALSPKFLTISIKITVSIAAPLFLLVKSIRKGKIIAPYPKLEFTVRIKKRRHGFTYPSTAVKHITNVKCQRSFFLEKILAEG